MTPPESHGDDAEYAIVRDENWDFSLEKFAKGQALSGGFPTRFEAIDDWLQFLRKQRQFLDLAIARAREIRMAELDTPDGQRTASPASRQTEAQAPGIRGR